MKHLIATVGLLLLATPTIGGDINVPGFFGADVLYVKCIAPAEGADANQCTGYVATKKPLAAVMQQSGGCSPHLAGIADSLEANRIANGLPNCVPPDVPLVRVRQAVTRSLLHYVATNPNVPHSGAGLGGQGHYRCLVPQQTLAR